MKSWRLFGRTATQKRNLEVIYLYRGIFFRFFYLSTFFNTTSSAAPQIPMCWRMLGPPGTDLIHFNLSLSWCSRQQRRLYSVQYSFIVQLVTGMWKVACLIGPILNTWPWSVLFSPRLWAGQDLLSTPSCSSPARHGRIAQPPFPKETNTKSQPVFRICDILLRIRIHGSADPYL